MPRGGCFLVLSSVLLHKVAAQSPTTTQTSTTQSTTPAPSNQSNEPPLVKFWRENWLWFLIAFLVVVIPICIWGIMGPGRKWYRARKRKRNSVPVLWDRVGNERFQPFHHNPSMREIRQISRSRGSGSSSRSDVALSSNAAAPGEQDIEATAANSSPTNSTSAYVQRERFMRNDSTQAVIGLVQPQPQSLMPPMPKSADRSSFGSIGPPDPHVHRAHPRYNSFQRYSRQHRKRTESFSAQQAPMSPQREELRESMQLSTPQILQRKSLPPNPPSQRQSIQANTAVQRVPLPNLPPSRPYHIRQNSVQSLQSLQSTHNRSTSWHQTTHRQAVPTNPYPSRHVSMDGYHPISEPIKLMSDSEPRRSVSRGRLQKPQHLNPRQSQQVYQPYRPPEREKPPVSYYRNPASSRDSSRDSSQENLGWPMAASETTISTSSAPRPAYPKPVYPARSALSSKSQSKDDQVHGTETGYTYSITAGNPPVKSVKFAALPPANNGVNGRFPIRHF